MLVSFSQNSTVGAVPSGPAAAISSISPQNGWLMMAAAVSYSLSCAACSTGLGSWSSPQDQVLRNQAVGSTCRVCVSGPALVTEIFISRSSGLALA